MRVWSTSRARARQTLLGSRYPYDMPDDDIDLQAAQCGYCINGIMVSVAGLLQQDVVPSDAVLLAALSRHLCRCGTHRRILRAARRAFGLAPASS